MLGIIDGDSIDNPVTLCGRFTMSSEFASLEVFMIRDRGNLIVGDTHHMIGGRGITSAN